VDIPSFPGAVLGLQEPIWRRTSDGLVGLMLGVGGVKGRKNLFRARVRVCEW
jgi:hypothetical protein